MDETIVSFLQSVLPSELFQPYEGYPRRVRPWVTATWAQSLDAKIAGKSGAQITLSGSASMHMTHLLRKHHWGIMVGINTLINDNPSLTARDEHGNVLPLADQPRPIILDSASRSPASSKIFANAAKGVSHTPMIANTGVGQTPGGAESLSVPPSRGRMSIETIVDELSRKQGGDSIMIEGGATVLETVIREAIADVIIITVAPTLVGEGVSVLQGSLAPPDYEFYASVVLEKDWVVAFRRKRDH